MNAHLARLPSRPAAPSLLGQYRMRPYKSGVAKKMLMFIFFVLDFSGNPVDSAGLSD